MKIRMPATVRMVMDSLHAKGYEAYIVGGCVRDSILGKRPNDWDITTNASPAQVKSIFVKTVDTGIEHGTVTVLVGGDAHEVTTYRVDGAYLDGRHPESVTFTASLAEDLKRRDFTINAMAYNDQDGLVDLHGGMEDIQQKMIRAVGDPMERFQEDSLRILRAVRFAAQNNFGIDRDTLAAAIQLAPTLSRISAERICAELTKIITSEHPEYLKVAYQAGMTRIFLPEFDACMETPQNNPHHAYTVGEHTLIAMRASAQDRVLRYALLLHDLGKPAVRTTDEQGVDHFYRHAQVSEQMAGTVMKRLKMDNDTIHSVKMLIRCHDWLLRPDERQIRKMLRVVGQELFPLLIKVQMADSMAKAPDQVQEDLARIIAATRVYEEILAKEQCFTLKDLAINGADLIAMGVPKGPMIGKLLNAALDRVIEDPGQNDREKLLRSAAEDMKDMNADTAHQGASLDKLPD